MKIHILSDLHIELLEDWWQIVHLIRSQRLSRTVNSYGARNEYLQKVVQTGDIRVQASISIRITEKASSEE